MTTATLEAAAPTETRDRAPALGRIEALDYMRGLVMILMSIDHASGAYNAGRVMTDSVHMYKPGTLLPAAQFLTRFITHLCAPSFVFLAGAAVALSAERRLLRGEPAGSVDRYLVQRGLLIAALDPLWMTWGLTGGRFWLLQVMYAIGTSLLAMALLRRLPTAWLVGCSLGLMLGLEALGGALTTAYAGNPPLAVGFLVTGAQQGKLIVGYPTLPWLAIMMLGWAFGRELAYGRLRAPERWLFPAGVGALALFALVRGVNGYGNMGLLRDGSSFVQWLHVSKYPPGLSYYTLLLGLGAVALAGFFVLVRHRTAFFGSKLLLVLGQTALFYYLLHVHLLEAAAIMLGVQSKLGLASAYVGGAAIVAFLYPFCLRYRGYKLAHPDGWTRYL